MAATDALSPRLSQFHSAGHFCAILRVVRYTLSRRDRSLAIGEETDHGESTRILTSLSEAQRAQAYARFEILCPALEEGVPQAQIARLLSFPRVRSNAGPRAFSPFRQRVSEVLREAFREQRPITTTEAERPVWADLQGERLALPVS